MLIKAEESCYIADSRTVALFEKVKRLENIDEAISTIKQIDALKTALESVDAFRAEAVRYAMLEAEALMRVVELGGANKLRGTHRKVAPWLFGLSISDRDYYIGMCADGLTIDQVYKREVEAKIAKAEGMSLLKDYRNDALSEIKSSGYTDITIIAEKARAVLSPDDAEDFIDGVRGRLRKAGAVGTSEGLYFMPNTGISSDIYKAIKTRFDGIINDILKIAEIAKASGEQIHYVSLTGEKWTRYQPNKDPIIFVLLALASMGAVEEKTLYNDIATKDWFEEIGYAKKYGVARNHVIDSAYSKIHGGSA